MSTSSQLCGTGRDGGGAMAVCSSCTMQGSKLPLSSSGTTVQLPPPIILSKPRCQCESRSPPKSRRTNLSKELWVICEDQALRQRANTGSKLYNTVTIQTALTLSSNWITVGDETQFKADLMMSCIYPS